MTNKEAKRIGEELLTQQMVGGEEDEYEEFLCVAIEALEKQIPKKPKHIGKHFECECGHWLLFDDEKPNENDNYCSHCSQAIDWSEA